MDLDSSEISGLAQEINSAIDSVTNVDQILAETADDLSRAQELQQRADRTKQNAEEQLKHAEEVTNFLSQAVEAQNKADISIQSAQEDIDSARKDLSQVSYRQERQTWFIMFANIDLHFRLPVGWKRRSGLSTNRWWTFKI